ncbi:hypothetical protein O181_049913 [Austropuccinia psidii MF-1]|uniref:Integrase catalytic domain-containing protein n=1 Tax=Austropuccinia psidii MF-1 TaxID=1389203 RepID=A0A9Q3DYD3_9BASI|nr:hypothetical protein [Austropuccinia psidii MF-1]
MDAVSIVVPNELISYSLLGKLGGNLHLNVALHSNLSNHTNNKKETSSSSLVTTYDEPHKIVFYCSQVKYNIRCTTHKKEECWVENPHLRPSPQKKKRKNNPLAHLSTAPAHTTIGGDLTPDQNQVVIDCGATHHMFSSPTFFCNPLVDIKSKFCDRRCTESSLCLWTSHTVLKALGLPDQKSPSFTCDTNKSHRLPFSHHFEPVSHPLDAIHLYLIGPISPESISGFKFFLTIVDQASSYKIVMFLKRKSDSFDQFLVAKNYMENWHSKKVRKIISIRGGKFLNQKLSDLADENGIIQILSPPETPEDNGYSERATRTILQKARCLINS